MELVMVFLLSLLVTGWSKKKGNPLFLIASVLSLIGVIIYCIVVYWYIILYIIGGVIILFIVFFSTVIVAEYLRKVKVKYDSSNKISVKNRDYYLARKTEKFETEKFGLIDTDENEVLPFIYDNITVISTDTDKYFIVEQKTKFGVVDINGNIVVPIEFDNCEFFYKSFIRVEKNGKFRIIDLDADRTLNQENYYDTIEITEGDKIKVKDNKEVSYLELEPYKLYYIIYKEYGHYILHHTKTE